MAGDDGADDDGADGGGDAPDEPVGPEFEDAVDELYGLHPDRFVPRRTELVRAARAVKDRETATALAALRKPSLGAWLANVLARESPEEVAALEELGSSLRTAQEQLSGDALRALTRQRRELVGALVARARRLARADGVGVGDSVARDLERTIAAALADGAAARAVAAGRLVTALEPGAGFDGGSVPARSTADGARADGASEGVRRPPPPRRADPEGGLRAVAGGGGSGGGAAGGGAGVEDDRRAAAERAEREQEEQEREEHRRAVEAADRAVERAREERDDARRAAERARSRAEQADTDLGEAGDAVVGLRQRLERAEVDEARAREQADEAREARVDAETAADEARRRLDQAEAARADLE